MSNLSFEAHCKATVIYNFKSSVFPYEKAISVVDCVTIVKFVCRIKEPVNQLFPAKLHCCKIN